jgi:hypothetical protein
VIEVNPEWGTAGFSRKLDGILGRGGYEGIHPDSHGNLILAEDIGGTKVSIDPTNPNGSTKTAANPNSFVYEEDNEPTGLHFSDGAASVSGLIGTQPLNPGISRLFVI